MMTILGRLEAERRLDLMKRIDRGNSRTFIIMIALLAAIASVELIRPFQTNWTSSIKRCLRVVQETVSGTRSPKDADQDLIDELTDLDTRVKYAQFDVDFHDDVSSIHARALSAIESRSRSDVIRIKNEMTELFDRIVDKSYELAEEAELLLDLGRIEDAESIIDRCDRLRADVDLINGLKYHLYRIGLQKTRSKIESIEHKLSLYENRPPQPPIDSRTAKEVEKLKSELKSFYVGIDMVRIEPGTFRMGSDVDDEDEKPVHEATITKAFEMSSHEITQKQYEQIVGDNPSWFSASGPGKAKVREDTSNHPVENLTIYEAILFCNKLSERVGLHPYYISDGKKLSICDEHGFRLPTEAEWEYACRAGSDQTFFFGNDEKDLDDFAWYKRNSNGKPHPVGQKKPNAWGLYDMQGNVMEWCFDYFDAFYYKSSPREDPLNTTPNRYSVRVLRGASWGSEPEDLRSSTRYMAVDWKKYINYGIRLARTP